MMQPQWQNGGFPQQGGWQGGYSPYGHELPEPEDTTPPHREGYERMSSRIFVMQQHVLASGATKVGGML